MTNERIAKTYTYLATQDKLRQLVWLVTEWEGGGVLMGNEINNKSGNRVPGVLISKHPLAVSLEVDA